MVPCARRRNSTADLDEERQAFEACATYTTDNWQRVQGAWRARTRHTHARTHATQMRRELHGHLWCSVCGGEHHLARVHQQSVRRVLLYFAEQLQACPPCAMPCEPTSAVFPLGPSTSFGR